MCEQRQANHTRILNSDDSLKEFPHGAYTAALPEPNWKNNEEDGLGWATKILPYIEEQAIYDQIVHNGIPGYDGTPWKPGIMKAAISAGNYQSPGGPPSSAHSYAHRPICRLPCRTADTSVCRVIPSPQDMALLTTRPRAAIAIGECFYGSPRASNRRP